MDHALSNAQWKQLVKENGVTGESLFYQHYDLCGFDPIYDLVIDVMYAVELNLIKSEMELMIADMGSNRDSLFTNDPLRMVALKREDLDQALEFVNWTIE